MQRDCYSSTDSTTTRAVFPKLRPWDCVLRFARTLGSKAHTAQLQCAAPRDSVTAPASCLSTQPSPSPGSPAQSKNQNLPKTAQNPGPEPYRQLNFYAKGRNTKSPKKKPSQRPTKVFDLNPTQFPILSILYRP